MSLNLRIRVVVMERGIVGAGTRARMTAQCMEDTFHPPHADSPTRAA